MAKYKQALAFSKSNLNTNDERGKGTKDRMVIADNISYKKSGSLNKREGFAKYKEDVINNLSVFRHYDLMTIGLFDYNTMNDIGLVDGDGNEYRPFTGVLNTQGDSTTREISNNLPLNPTRHVQFNLTDSAREHIQNVGIYTEEEMKELQNDFMLYDNFFSNGEMVNEIIYTFLFEESVKHINPTLVLSKNRIDFLILIMLIGQEKVFGDIIPKIEDLAIRQDVEDFINASNTFIQNKDTIISNVLAKLQSFFEPKFTRVRAKIKEVYKMSNLFKESVVKTSYDKIQPLSAFNKLTNDEKLTFINNLDKSLGKNFSEINDVYDYFTLKIESDGSFGDVYKDIFDIFLTGDNETVKDKLVLLIQNTIALEMYKQDWAKNDISFFSTEEANAFRNDIPFNRLNEDYILTDERTVKYEAIRIKGFHGDKVGIGNMHIDDTNTFFPSVVYFSDYDHYKDPLLNNYLSNIGQLQSTFLYATQGIDLDGDNLIGDLRIDTTPLIPNAKEFFDRTGYMLDHVVDSSSNMVMVANTQANGNLSNIFENIITIVLPKNLGSVAINRLRELDNLKLMPYLGTPITTTGTKVVKIPTDNDDMYLDYTNDEAVLAYNKELMSTTLKKTSLIKIKSVIDDNDRTISKTIPKQTYNSQGINLLGFYIEPANKQERDNVGAFIVPKDPAAFDPAAFDPAAFDPQTDITYNGANGVTVNPNADFEFGYKFANNDDELFITNNTSLYVMLVHSNTSGVPVDNNNLNTIPRIWIAMGEVRTDDITVPTNSVTYKLITEFMTKYDQDLSIKSTPQGIIKTNTLKVRQATFKEGIDKIESQFSGSATPSIPLNRISNNDITKISYNISNVENGFTAFLDDEGFVIGKNKDLNFEEFTQLINNASSSKNNYLYLRDKRLGNIIALIGSNINVQTQNKFYPTIDANSQISSNLKIVPDTFILCPKFSFTIDSGNDVNGIDFSKFMLEEDIKNIIEADKQNELGIRVNYGSLSQDLAVFLAFGTDSQKSTIEAPLLSILNKVYNRNFKTLDEFEKSANNTLALSTHDFKCPKLEIAGDGFRVNIDVTNRQNFETDWGSSTSEITNSIQSSLIFNAFTNFQTSGFPETYSNIQFINTKTGRVISSPNELTNFQIQTYVGYKGNDQIRLLEKTTEKAIKKGDLFQYNLETSIPKIFNGIEQVNSPISEITKIIGIQQDGTRIDIPLDGTYSNNAQFSNFEVTSVFLEDTGTLDNSIENRIPKLQISNTTLNTRSDIFNFLTDFSVNDFADITLSVWNNKLYFDSVSGINIENFSAGDVISNIELGENVKVVDWVKFKDQIFITTGKKIYVLSLVKNNILTRKDANGDDETVGDNKYYISFEEMNNIAYIPNSQEFTLYGPNVIVDNIDKDVEDSLALPFSVDFIRINPFKGQVGKTSVIKAIVSGTTQTSIDAYTYKWEYLDSNSEGKFKEIKTLNGVLDDDNGTALTTKEISVVFPKDDTYTLKVTVTSGTTNLSELTKYTVSNSEVDVLTPTSLMNDINKCERVIVNGNTLIFYGNGTSNVYATAPENPYYFPFGNTLNISINKNEEVQALVNLKDLVLAFTRTTISAITGSGNPAQIESLFDPYRVIQIESKVGAVSKYGATNIENMAMFVSEDGVYVVEEVSVSDQRASLKQLDIGVQNIIPKDSSVNINATEKRLFIGSAITGSVLVYDYEFSKWAIWTSANLKAEWARTIDNVYYLSNGVNILAKNRLIKQNEFYTYPRYYFTDDKETYAMRFQTSQSDMSVISSDFFVDGSFAFKKASSFRMKWKYNSGTKNFPTVTLIGGGEGINTPTNEYNNVQYENNVNSIPKPPAVLSEFRLGENNIQIENGKDNYFNYIIDKSPWFMWYSILFIHVGDSPMELTDMTTTYTIGPESRDRNGKF